MQGVATSHIQCHVMLKAHATLQGAATSRIKCRQITSGFAFLTFHSYTNRNAPEWSATLPVVGQRGPRTGDHGVARIDSDHAECHLSHACMEVLTVT